MSALLTPPPVGPRPFQWDRALFMRVGSLPMFEGRRLQLIRGELWELGSMTPIHACGLTLVHDELHRRLSGAWMVRNQCPIDFGPETMPLPDLAVVSPEWDVFVKRHPFGNEVRLMVEVADDSQQFDLTTKAELYATAGIAEYWVVDVLNRVVHVLRDPGPLAAGGTAYRDAAVIDAAGSVAPLAAPTATVRVADLLP